MQDKLNHLNFDNHFINQLPADNETANYRRQVKNACYSYVHPTPGVIKSVWVC